MLTFLFWVFIGIPCICLLAQAAYGISAAIVMGAYVALGGKVEN